MARDPYREPAPRRDEDAAAVALFRRTLARERHKTFLVWIFPPLALLVLVLVVSAAYGRGVVLVAAIFLAGFPLKLLGTRSRRLRRHVADEAEMRGTP
jgi:hypothetical protein